jgi:hypothetical protein
MKNQELLNLKIKPIDFEEITVGDFLLELLKTLWEEGESFSTKRPFGYSFWQWDLARAMGKAGAFPMKNEGTEEVPDWVLQDAETEKAAMLAISELVKSLVLSCRTN